MKVSAFAPKPRAIAQVVRLLVAAAILGAGLVSSLGTAPPAKAVAVLAIAPASWNFIGLDNTNQDPVADGPDTFMVGAVITNTGNVTATNVVANWVWDTANIYISIAPTSTATLTWASLAPGAFVYAYFNVRVQRLIAARDTTRRFHITATADTLGTISTPTPRELYVEKIQSQNRNHVNSITGPDGTGGLQSIGINQTVLFTTSNKTAPGGYEQLVTDLPFPNNLFQVLAVTSTYPTNGLPYSPNNIEYADSCTWVNDPTSPKYHNNQSCLGTGKSGDDPVITVYRVKTIAPGNIRMADLVYDFSGSSYHYNDDYLKTTVSYIDVCISSGCPNAARVTDMAAAPNKAGGVDLQWSSVTELDHLGFRVRRADSPAGPYQPISAGLILSQGAAGGVYRFYDAKGMVKSYYQIEAIDTHNQTETFKPFAVGKSLPAISAQPDLDKLAKQGAANAQANAAALAPKAAPQALGSQPYRLLVSKSGVVRVTYEALAAAGVLLPNNKLAYLTLTTGPAGARTAVPLALRQSAASRFGPGDSFDFIAQAAPSAYGDSRAYYLSIGSTPGARIPGAGLAPVSSAASTFRDSLHLEENHSYWYQWQDHGGAQVEGAWYWTSATTNADATATLTVPNVDATQAANLTLSFEGYTSNALVPADHHLEIYLNNTRLGDKAWSGLGVQQATFAVPGSLLQSGANTLRLHVVGDTGVAYESTWLIGADVSYAHRYRAAGDALAFTVNDKRTIRVGGFTDRNVLLYDVTNPAAPKRVTSLVSPGDGYTLRANVPGRGLTRLLAVAANGVVRPDSILPVATSDLRQGGADYVVVAYDSMVSAGQQLAAYHTAEGLSTRVVPVSAVYDQFGSGAPDASALRAFFAYAQASWAPAPRYAVLLGSASVDPHNYLGLGNNDLVPTAFVPTTAVGRTASDAALVGAPGSTLRLALGRLPAHNPSEATALVQKLISYGSTGHSWAQQVSLVSDSHDDFGWFDAASDSLAGTLGSVTPNRIFESTYGAATGDQLVAAFNGGSALVNYYGHGNPFQWGSNGILTRARVSQISNAGHESFVTAMTCWNGLSAYAQGNSTLTDLLLKSSGGIVGGIGATGFVETKNQEPLANAVYAAILAGQRVGDALLAGYAASGDADTRAEFQLLGDPALRVDLTP